MKISDIGKYKWDREEESYDTWYDSEISLRAYYYNPLGILYPLPPLYSVVANNACFYEHIGDQAWDKVGAEVVRKGPKFLANVVKESERYIKRTEKTLERLRKAKRIDKKLFFKVKEALTDLWYVFALDLGYYLPNAVDEVFTKKGLSLKQIEEIKRFYLTPHKLLAYQKEERNLLNIISLWENKDNLNDLNKDSLPKEMLMKLKSHQKKFSWMTSSDLDTAPAGIEYYISKIKELILVSDKLKSFPNLNKNTKKFLNNEDKSWLELISQHIYLDNYAQDVYQQIKYCFQTLIMDTFKVPFRSISFYTISESEGLIRTGKRLDEDEIVDRGYYWVIVQINGEVATFYGKENYLRASSLLRKGGVADSPTAFKGMSACFGYVKGTVKIVKGIKDIEKVEKGDILVSGTTRPDLMAAILRCSAIVTDSGGITSHAAIVARELNIPCIVGSGIATEILKDGDVVEVNANEGIVRILER